MQPNEIVMPERTTVLGDFLEKNLPDELYYNTVVIDKILKWGVEEHPLTWENHSKFLGDFMENQMILNHFNMTFKDNHIVLKLSDGSTRKLGKREKEMNWLLPLTKRYDGNIVNDPRGEISTLTTSNVRKVFENVLDLEKNLQENRVNIKDLFSTFNQENYITGNEIGGGWANRYNHRLRSK